MSTRPDYNQLGECAPDVTHTDIYGDGFALLEFTIPDSCSAQPWNVATFHVVDPNDWFGKQTETDNQSGVFGPGPHSLVLKTEPGACQLDMWQAPNDQVYAAATSLDCAPAQASPVLTPAAPAPEIPVVVLGTSSELPPAALPATEARQVPGEGYQGATVALVAAQPILPVTGPVLPPELGASLAVAFLLVGCASVRLAKLLQTTNRKVS